MMAVDKEELLILLKGLELLLLSENDLTPDQMELADMLHSRLFTQLQD